MPVTRKFQPVDAGVSRAVIGTRGNDEIIGTDRRDRMIGDDGDDRLFGRDGDDLLIGGSGNDYLDGGEGTDRLIGNDGADTFVFRELQSKSPDRISDFRSADGDKIDLSSISGHMVRSGLEPLHFSGQNPSPYAVWYRPGAYDHGYGSRLAVDVNGDAVPDVVVRLQGVLSLSVQDLILAGPEEPVVGRVLEGTEQSDLLYAGPGRDHIDGRGNDDAVDYRDTLLPVNVVLSGGRPTTVIVDDAEEDVIVNIEHAFGGFGDDWLAGDDRNNILSGRFGSDILVGGLGADTLTGGPGSDRFLYLDPLETHGDLIVDFSRAQGDVVDISSLDANVLVPGHQEFMFSGQLPRANSVWYRMFIEGDNALHIQGDVDGNPETSEVDIAVEGLSSVAASDLNLSTVITDDTAYFSGSAQPAVISLEHPVFQGLSSVVGARNASNSIQSTESFQGTFIGGDKGNTIIGSVGDDILSGGKGDDTLYGEDGNDLLEGGPGADSLTGGAGADRFRYRKESDAVDDVIMDFNRDQGDWIDLHQVDANIYDSSWQILSFNGAKAARHSLWYKPGEDGEGVILCGDTDGNIRTREITIEVKGVTALLASDFDMPVLSPDTPDISTTLQALHGLLVPVFPDNVLDGFRQYDDEDDAAGLGFPAMRGGVPVDLERMPEGFPSGNDGVSGPEQDDRGDVDSLVPEAVFGEDPYSARSSISGYTSHQFSNFLLRVLNEEDRFSGLHGENTDRLTGPETLDFSATSNYRLINVAMYRGVNNVVGPQASGTEIRGDNGPNVLTGGDGPDVIYGEAGDDILIGGLGNDIMYGGSGNDILTGEEGKDTLYGDDGNDILTGGAGADTMHGGRGHDTLTGDAGNDVLEGGEGSDTLSGGAGADVLRGGEGHDILSGGLGADRFRYVSTSEASSDTIADFSRVQGDWIDLHGIDSGSDPDVWQGLVFHGTTARPHALWYQVDGNGRGVRLYGDTDGNVTSHEISIAVRGVTTLEARDLPLPTFTTDTVDFSSVRNYTTVSLSDYREISNVIGSRMVGMELYGTGADNTLTGGDGDDSLYGAGGNDILAGGDGKDVLTGGSGADTFLFWSVAGTVGDVITDFSRTQGDKLDFDLIDADSVAEGSQDLGFTGTTPQAYSVWYTPNVAATDVVLCGDTDGHADTTEIAFLLKGVSSLSETDFLF